MRSEGAQYIEDFDMALRVHDDMVQAYSAVLVSRMPSRFVENVFTVYQCRKQ